MTSCRKAFENFLHKSEQTVGRLTIKLDDELDFLENHNLTGQVIFCTQTDAKTIQSLFFCGKCIIQA